VAPLGRSVVLVCRENNPEVLRKRRKEAMTRAAEDLLRQARKLRKRMVVFDRKAQGFLGRLEIPDEEVAAMSTPASNLLGTLECLCGDDLKAALRKLDELDGLLREGPVPGT
jgi:hypothetical protein